MVKSMSLWSIPIFFIIILAVVYWYITISLIIIIIIIIIIYSQWKKISQRFKKSHQKDFRTFYDESYKKEYYSQSRGSQSRSYENYHQYDYENCDSNDYNKKSTQDESYQKSRGKSKTKSKAGKTKANRVNSRLEKFHITPDEAKIIFGKTWRVKLGKQEWEFYWIIRFIEIDFENDYNNNYRNKYGSVYSKVLQIIKIVMEENADLREEEEQNKHESGQDEDSNWDNNDYDYNNNYNDDSQISDDDIIAAFEIFELTRDSTKEQIKRKYRELVLKFHPDKNKSNDSTVKMTEINRAYEIIMEAVTQ